jgi:hypothetical protein
MTNNMPYRGNSLRGVGVLFMLSLFTLPENRAVILRFVEIQLLVAWVYRAWMKKEG